MKKYFIPVILVTIITALPLQSQDVNIPDDNFLSALIAIGVDANKDGSISQSEAEKVTDLDIQMKSIVDMTGLEAFSNLENLQCQMNQIDSLNLSGNPSVKYLSTDMNRITYLNVSNNLALISLVCSNNWLDTLDVSNNLALETLVLSNNKVKYMDASDLPVLEHLECSSNQMATLDVSNDTSLNMLNCMDNKLTNLDLSSCQALTYIQLIDIPSLQQVCVWITPFPPMGVTLKTSGSPNITFWDCLAPVVYTPADTLFNIDTAVVVSNENGIIYLVPDSTKSEIEKIRIASIDSVATKADSVASVSLTGIQKGFYLFFAADLIGNLSEPDSFVFLGNNLDFDPPVLQIPDALYQPDSLELVSSEEGMVYLVPVDIGNDLNLIMESALDSIAVKKDSVLKISLEGLGNGLYWLYARDTVFNLSIPYEFEILGVGIRTAQSGNKLLLFPNPVKDILWIQSKDVDLQIISILALDGRLMLQEEMFGTTKTLDLSSYQSGVYIINFQSDMYTESKFILKQ